MGRRFRFSFTKLVRPTIWPPPSQKAIRRPHLILEDQPSKSFVFRNTLYFGLSENNKLRFWSM
jgi:hypothetical protein